MRIYIGGESRVVPYEELSVVSAPYEVDGQVVGTLGVIGPTRMAYDRMIQIVDITSRLVSNALSHKSSGARVSREALLALNGKPREAATDCPPYNPRRAVSSVGRAADF